MPATAPPAGTLVSDAEDVGSVSGDMDTEAITRSSIQGPRCPPHHCPAPASAEVCGDDGNMEVEEMETSQQQHLILVIQVCAGFSAVWPARGSVM
jgi:hypothetical protein